MALRIIPLGGLGEVGMNCMVLEEGDRAIVVDCGVLFPDDEAPGVDVIHPSFDYLLGGRARIEGLVLTHGHEDHIGGVPYFLRHFDVPVLGPPLALALVKERLKEHSLPREPRFVETRPGVQFDLGPFSIEPIRVTHSIPDAQALCIDSPTGRVLHSGDFKIDRTPVDGKPFDEDRIRSLAGDEGVGLLLSDSTNAEVAGRAPSENDVRPTLDAIVRDAPQAVLVALFSSNIHRLQVLFDAARAHARKVVMLGRSVRTHERIASDLGILSRRGVVVVTPEEAAVMPRRGLLAILSGAQGEPGAALGRLASGEMRPFALERGDTVVLSSRVIPGNERPVQRILDALARRGARVIHRGVDPAVHVSGHAQSDDQRSMLEMARPRGFLPIHGTRTFLEHHAGLARTTGVPSALVVENGMAVRWEGGQELGMDGPVPAGRVHVDGTPIGPEALRERRALCQAGIAFVAVPWADHGRLGPLVALRGIADPKDAAALERGAAQAVADAIDDLPSVRRRAVGEVRDTARLAVRRYLRLELGRIPVAVAVVVEPAR